MSKEAMATCPANPGEVVWFYRYTDEKDKNRIALELGLRDTAHWKSILLKRIEECSNPDEKSPHASSFFQPFA
jgi:hypothetical protein